MFFRPWQRKETVSPGSDSYRIKDLDAKTDTAFALVLSTATVMPVIIFQRE